MMGAGQWVNGSMPRILVGVGEFFCWGEIWPRFFDNYEVQLGKFGPSFFFGSCDLQSAVYQDFCIKLVGIQGMKKGFRFSWVPNLYNIHFLVENHRPQPDPVNENIRFFRPWLGKKTPKESSHMAKGWLNFLYSPCMCKPNFLQRLPSGELSQFAMERSTMLLMGKSTISTGPFSIAFC